MKLALRIPVILLMGILAGCGAKHTGHSVSVNPFAPPPLDPEAPPRPAPVETGQCPYLEASAVEQANGQRVSVVRRSEDEPYPACFFYGQDGREQLSVWVYTGDPGTAESVVNAAAPVGTAEPVWISGWQGGFLSGPAGSVYAIGRTGSSVVVTSNQPQKAKSKRIALRVIGGLQL